MERFLWGIIACLCVLVAGCFKSSEKPPEVVPAPAAKESAKAPERVEETAAAPTTDTTNPDNTAAENAAEEAAPETPAEGLVELKLDGIRFVVPGGWKAVKPQTNIVDAEFELPRVDGDEFDGRLTLMFSGGDPQEVIANRSAEFMQAPSQTPHAETLRIGSVDATWVDLQGVWRGPAFRPIEPRPDYRMLLVIIPFTEHSAFYVKLTGPQATIAAHESGFRDFVRSAKITHPGFE
jgi:hypothetical protein